MFVAGATQVPERFSCNQDLSYSHDRHEEIKVIVIGVVDVGEQKIVEWTNTGRENLAEIDPLLLINRRDEVEASHRRPEGNRSRAIDKNAAIASLDRNG